MKTASKLKFPGGPGLPPPPLVDHEDFIDWWMGRLADFYHSPHFDEWYRQTNEEMRRAKPFVLKPTPAPR
jgi:hypothetical protein